MSSTTTPFALAIHGGAGTIRSSDLTAQLEADYRAGLRRSLLAGYAVLSAGGSAVDAVTEAVKVMEDDPLFNSGRGAVYTSDGGQEMDAAIMDGNGRHAGAVAAIRGPRNPIVAARAVMEQSEHVLLAGDGALAFSRAQGIPMAPDSYFHTERRWDALQKELARRLSNAPDDRDDADRHGTVGAVALDASGDLAAATSTGGITAKAPGRVGDTPIVGAGTWAENGVCAVSATGTGEVFIRLGAAHEIAARIRLGGQDIAEAAGGVIADIGVAGGDGGLIAVDAAGTIVLPFNASGMYRGTVGPDGVVRTAIYHGDLEITEA